MRNITKAVLLVSVALTSCKSIGPTVLKNDRYNYNMSMGYSNQQELLLNIVRLRYDDPPMAMKVGSISGSTHIVTNTRMSGKIGFPARGSSNGDADADASINYSDNPVINYTPLDDQAFTQQFLHSLELSDIGLLLQSAWSIPRVFRVTMQSAGTAVNAPSAARSTSSHPPEYQDFIDMVYVLRRAQIDDAIAVHYTKHDTQEELVLVIRPDYQFTAKELSTLRKAGVNVNNHRIVFTNYPAPGKAYVVTRSMLGVLNYLSKGTQVPAEDVKAKLVTVTTHSDGRVFDWQQVLKGMIKVYSSNKEPDNASVSILYHGHWYYIKATDSDSKQTMVLLTNLTGLTQTTPPGSTIPPALTRIAK